MRGARIAPLVCGASGPGKGGDGLDLLARLRQLDWEVERARAALAALQRDLSATVPEAGGRGWRRGAEDGVEEYLRAYV